MMRMRMQHSLSSYVVDKKREGFIIQNEKKRDAETPQASKVMMVVGEQIEPLLLLAANDPFATTTTCISALSELTS